MLRMQERISTSDIASRSASGSTMALDLPPSSSVTGRSSSPQAAAIFRPTGVDPVNATLSHASGCLTSVSPSRPDAGDQVDHPGRYARRRDRVDDQPDGQRGGRRRLDHHGAAGQQCGRELDDHQVDGEVPRRDQRAHPTGSRRTTDSAAAARERPDVVVLQVLGEAWRSSGRCRPRWRPHRRFRRPVSRFPGCWSGDSASARFSTSSAIRSRYVGALGRGQPRPRPRVGTARRPGPTAASTSSGVPSGTEPHTSPVAGSVTGLRPVPRAAARRRRQRWSSTCVCGRDSVRATRAEHHGWRRSSDHLRLKQGVGTVEVGRAPCRWRPG